VGAYAELVAADSRTLHFVPGGLAPGVLRPDDAVAFQTSVIADAVLVEAVPGGVRSRFERLRDKHVRGVSDYENFAEVCNQATSMYEPVLQERFVEFFRGRDIPFTASDGTPAPVRAARYSAVQDHVQGFERAPWLQAASGPVTFNGMLHGLMTWARAEGLLRGQRARARESLVVKRRNRISHGQGDRLVMPPQSATEIRDLAEFINQLWGSPTTGGRWYPAAVAREVLALGRDPVGNMVLARAANLPDDEPYEWVLLRGVFHDLDQFQFDSRYLTNGMPTSYLWGPGTAVDARAWLVAEQPEPVWSTRWTSSYWFGTTAAVCSCPKRRRWRRPCRRLTGGGSGTLCVLIIRWPRSAACGRGSTASTDTSPTAAVPRSASRGARGRR
jgi:hypothetical protein